jgi:FkbM family methyltransferase
VSSISTALRSSVHAAGRLLTRALLDPRWRHRRPVRWTYVHLYLLGKRLIERSELAVVRDLTAKGMVVLDIGANVGFYAVRIAEWVGPTGRVLAFEPDPFSFRVLQERARTSPHANIETYPVALGDITGEAVLYCGAYNRADNRLHASHDEPLVEQHLVEVCPLDAFLARNGREKVDALKIDVQGAEESVLRGAQATLRRGGIEWIWIEFSPSHLRGAGTDPARFLERLTELDMDVFEVDDGRLRPITQLREYERRIGSGSGDIVLRRPVKSAGATS